MNFSAWAIRNPVAPLLGFFMLMVLGWQSFNRLPITEMPNIDAPFVMVTTVQAGAAPTELEAQVTKEIEDAVAGITGVKTVTSTINDGLSTTLVEFRMEVPSDQAVQDTKDAIDAIIGDLPGGVEAPIVRKLDIAGSAIMTWVITSPGRTLEELSWFVDDTVTRALQGREGIGRVDRYGGVDREILIRLDPLRLASHGTTALAVSQQVAATNADAGAGKAELGRGEQSIRTLGNQQTVEALARMTIALPSGRHVRLADLGEVIDSHAEPKSFGRRDGQPVVAMAIYRSKGASEVEVAEVVEAALKNVQVANPDISFDLVDDAVYFTRGNYESAMATLIEGSLLAILVVLAFLRNWRATLIAAVALPLSAVPTFWLMELLGFSLNLVSFLAITLATGILVDDAIVEIENIARHIRMGKTPWRASIDAADEIGLAVIATAMTIVAVFVPVSFMPGIPGQYFRQFGMTVAIAVLFSLLVARLLTPMMAAWFMRAKDAMHEGSHGDGWIMRGYLRLVRLSTASPRIGGIRLPGYYLTIVIAIGVVMLSVQAMMQIPANVFPPDDRSRILISVELPPGSTLSEVDRTTEAMRTAIADIPGVARVMIVGGSSPMGDREIRRATMTVLLDRRDVTLERRLFDIAGRLPLIGPMLPIPQSDGRTQPQSEIEAEVFARFRTVPDVRAYKLEGPGPGGRPFAFDILSPDAGDLARGAAMIESAVAGVDFLENVALEGNLPRPEILITPRPDEAARLGVTTQALAATVRVATIGDQDAALAKLSIDNRMVPVRVQLDNAAREDLDRIAALKVMTARGTLVPISAVADVRLSEGPAQIKRMNRERVATLGADLPRGVVLDEATQQFEAIIAGLDLPASLTVRPSGDAEIQAELVSSFLNAMIMGLMLVMTVLILLFRSVIQPFTILLSLPLAIGGVAAALILAQSPVSMPVMIGILMLMGIVTKNAILLIDFAIEMRARGLDRIAAVVEAGHKRAQPIVMTSIAMSAGMIPSALGVGEGGTFRSPMAIAVIGGIIMSTVLSLVVVPAMYLFMDDVSRLAGWLFGRFIGKREEEPEMPPADVLAGRIEAGQQSIGLLNARIAALEARLSPSREAAGRASPGPGAPGMGQAAE